MAVPTRRCGHAPARADPRPAGEGASRGHLRAPLPQPLRAGGGHHPLRAVHGRARQHGDAGALPPLSRRRPLWRAAPGRAWRRSSARPASSAPRRRASSAARGPGRASTAARCRATLDALVKLPGIGRKTANVVLGHAYDIAEGIAVDTHVLRVSNRLGIAQGDDPIAVEQQLMALIPQRALDAHDRPAHLPRPQDLRRAPARLRRCAPSSPSAAGRSARPSRWARRPRRRPTRRARAGARARGRGQGRAPMSASLAAAVQMTSTADVERNLRRGRAPGRRGGRARRALRGPARELRVPALARASRSRRRRRSTAPWVRAPGRARAPPRRSPCCSAACPRRSRATRASTTRPSCSGPDGATLAVYRKIHLFDIDLPGMEHLKESRAVAARRGRRGRPTRLSARSASPSATTCAFPSCTGSWHGAARASWPCPPRSPSAPARTTGRSSCAPAPSRTWPTWSRPRRSGRTARAAPPTATP